MNLMSFDDQQIELVGAAKRAREVTVSTGSVEVLSVTVGNLRIFELNRARGTWSIGGINLEGPLRKVTAVTTVNENNVPVPLTSELFIPGGMASVKSAVLSAVSMELPAGNRFAMVRRAACSTLKMAFVFPWFVHEAQQTKCKKSELESSQQIRPSTKTKLASLAQAKPSIASQDWNTTRPYQQCIRCQAVYTVGKQRDVHKDAGCVGHASLSSSWTKIAKGFQ